MKKLLATGLIATASLCFSNTAMSADYVIDTKGAHASIQFRVKHLGYSWLVGRFNKFEGQFSYDADAPEKTTIEVKIDPASIDSNHAERDKHLRGDDFLDVRKYRASKFVGTGLEVMSDGKMVLTGDFTLHGHTNPIQLQVSEIGEGQDPWGGYRHGFTAFTVINTSDYGFKSILSPVSRQIELFLNIEGVRQ
ncbi:MAG: YceI family protein [Pseudomonadales bacterium]